MFLKTRIAIARARAQPRKYDYYFLKQGLPSDNEGTNYIEEDWEIEDEEKKLGCTQFICVYEKYD
jgi:hypothetical protein